VIRLPREYWALAVIAWSVALALALVMAIPYWAGGHTWLIHYPFAYPIGTFVLLGARLAHRWRYGSYAEIELRHGIGRRERRQVGLIIVAGVLPSAAVIALVTAQAGIGAP
jgi:hypothetical protein